MTLKEGFKQYPKILIASLTISIITAFFSNGYHNPDEHWQINEFAAYKLGLASYNEMPWELEKQARQTIQPTIVFALANVMMGLKIFNPFNLALFLRIISSLLAFISTNLIVLQAKNNFRSINLFKFCLILANFLWFIPYVHVRFQGENWAGIFFAFAVFLVIKTFENEKKNKLFFLAGLCLGLSFDFRYQIAFSIIALGLWLISFKKINPIQMAFFMIGFLLCFGLGVLIDSWFYNQPVFVPYRYFYIQVVEAISSNWGVFPWWYYIKLFLMHVAPPLSFILLIGFFAGSITHPKNLYVWLVIAFVIGHSTMAYKEIRYLYPMIPYFCIMVFLPMNKPWFEKKWLQGKHFKAIKVFIIILLIQNSLLLLISTFKPANEIVGLLSEIYNKSKKHKTVLLYDQTNPYYWGKIKYNFYQPKNIKIFPLDSFRQKNNFITPNTTFLIATPTFDIDTSQLDFKIKPVYKTIPNWLRNFNFNNWISRSNVWSLYEITKKK